MAAGAWGDGRWEEGRRGLVGTVEGRRKQGLIQCSGVASVSSTGGGPQKTTISRRGGRRCSQKIKFLPVPSMVGAKGHPSSSRFQIWFPSVDQIGVDLRELRPIFHGAKTPHLESTFFRYCKVAGRGSGEMPRVSGAAGASAGNSWRRRARGLSCGGGTTPWPSGGASKGVPFRLLPYMFLLSFFPSKPTHLPKPTPDPPA